MVGRLQRIADDLAERVFIQELELRSRSLERRIEAVEDLGHLSECIELCRQELEDQQQSAGKLGKMLSRLESRVSNIKSSPAYRVAEWLGSANLSWFIGAESSLLTNVC